MKVLDTIWFTSMIGNIGLVIGEDSVTAERKAYIAQSLGHRKDLDTEMIIELGAPFTPDIANRIAQILDPKSVAALMLQHETDTRRFAALLLQLVKIEDRVRGLREVLASTPDLQAKEVAQIRLNGMVDLFDTFANTSVGSGILALDLEQEKAHRFKLENAVNDILAEAESNKELFKNDPINWGDLGCTSIDIQIDALNQKSYLITIEEADPSCQALPRFVRQRLEEKGFHDFEIVTEW